MKVQITALNVIAIYVENLEESLKFYTEVLGMKRGADQGPGVLLDSGANVTIYLEGGASPQQTASMSRAHMSVCFGTDSIRATWKSLSSQGVPVVMSYEEFSPTFAMFAVADPSGNVIEFAGKP